MKKRGFTLIEMMIVIVIVSILLALSLGISGNRIQTLKNKSIQEQFNYAYNSLFSRNLLTNYYSEESYDKMVIHLSVGENRFSYSYKKNDTDIFSGYDGVQGGKYQIKSLAFEGDMQGQSNIYIDFTPYVLGCELSSDTHTGKVLKMVLSLNDMEDYCIKINSDLCKLEKVACEE